MDVILVIGTLVLRGALVTGSRTRAVAARRSLLDIRGDHEQLG
jgi:hypothetical protein